MFKLVEQNVVLGTSGRGLFKRKETLTQAQMNHHVHIVGASGFGKSVLLSHIIRHEINSGKGLLYIDLKGDIETINEFSEVAKMAGRESDFQIFNLENVKISSSYNPIGHGSANQIRDQIMQAFTWTEEYYKHQVASFLLRILIPLCHLRDLGKLEITFELLLRLSKDSLEVKALAELIDKSEKSLWDLIDESFSWLRVNENFTSLQGFRSQLEGLVFSDFSKLLKGNMNSKIDLFESVNQQKLTFIFLDSRRYGETARTLGKLMLQDLKATSSRIDSEILRADRKNFSVIIDEFGDLAQDDFLSFLDRARSSKLAVIFAHQELSDLNRISPEFAARLMGNTATLYAFLQKRPESAEMISGIAGTRKVMKATLQSEKLFFIDVPTGNKSFREVEEFIVHPNTIKSLRVGECVAIKKYPSSRTCLVDIASD